jgi:Secretion system C-terminal sorting domain
LKVAEKINYQKYPNPFNPVTTIQFDIKPCETGKLMIHNVKGQLIDKKEFSEGAHKYIWNAELQSSGIYFYQLKTDSFNELRRMVLLQ